MKKFLLSIFAVMLAVFSVQAEEVTLNASDVVGKGKSGGGGGFEYIVSPISFNFSSAYGNSDTELRFYKSSTLEISGATITKVQFTAASSKYGGTVTANSGSITVDGLTQTWEGSTTSLIITATGSQIRTASIVVTYTTSGEGGGEVLPTAEKPEFTPGSCEFNLGESFTVEISAAEGATIYYTTDGETPTEVSNVYEKALTITETTTVKAIAVIEGHNNSAVAEAKYTAVDPNAKEVDATISFASTAQRLSQDGNSQVWSNGGITFTNNKSASQNAVVGNTNPVRLYAGSELVIEAASGNIKKIIFDCNNASYATTLKTSIGNAATVSSDKVTVTLDGTSNNFTVATLTAQVRMDALTVTYLVSASQEEKPAAPTFSVETGTKFYPTLEFEISAAEGAVIYYTLNGENPTTESDVYSTPITIEETTVVKAIAVIDGAESEVASASYKKVIDSVTGNVADAFYYYVGGEQIPAVITGYIVGAVNGTSFGDGGENCKFDVTEIENAANILIADNADETDYTKCLVVQLPSGDIRTALNLVDNPDNLKKKVVLTATLETYFGVVGLKSTSAYKFIPEYTLSVTAVGYATLFLDFNARIPSAVEAYTVTTVNEGWVSLTQVTGVLPLNQGVIIKAPAGDYKFFYEETATADVTGNLLSGSAYNKNIDEEAYVLGKVDGVVGLYKAEMVGGVWLNNANKAYLPASVANGAASYSFRFGEGTTGIDQITDNREQSTAIYDLTGRRVENPSNGIYIINGVKVLVK